MSEREAFGPHLKRQRVQRGIPLDHIAASTKASVEMWEALERNDFSQWPMGIYARAHVRAYALEVGLDPDATVDEFCRCFPNGDRRVDRLVREQAAIIGHDLRWKDDLVGSVTDERRAAPVLAHASPLPELTSSRTGRVVAAVLDLSAVVAVAGAASALLPIRWPDVLAMCAVVYPAASLVTLGCSPAVWVLDTYLTNRYPETSRAWPPRFVRLLTSSPRAKA